jgi:TRAP-type mannitol/chloroaromatic compound transport system permease large subunit
MQSAFSSQERRLLVSQENRRQRVRGLPLAGIVFLIVGGALAGIGAGTDSGVLGFVGWVIVVASAILVVMGLLARGAAK